MFLRRSCFFPSLGFNGTQRPTWSIWTPCEYSLLSPADIDIPVKLQIIYILFGNQYYLPHFLGSSWFPRSSWWAWWTWSNSKYRSHRDTASIRNSPPKQLVMLRPISPTHMHFSGCLDTPAWSCYRNRAELWFRLSPLQVIKCKVN